MKVSNLGVLGVPRCWRIGSARSIYDRWSEGSQVLDESITADDVACINFFVPKVAFEVRSLLKRLVSSSLRGEKKIKKNQFPFFLRRPGEERA